MGGKRISRGKQGQVTIFIIIAIVIVVFGLLIYMFVPDIKSTIGLETKDPYSFMRSCMQDKIEVTIENLSLQGGSIHPDNFYKYMGYDIQYTCYAAENYRLCTVQQPFLRKHIESELTDSLSDDVDSCFVALKEDYEKKGYAVNLKKDEFKIELLPKRIMVDLGHEVTLTKDTSEKYEDFNIVLNNNLYELTAIASSITEWETTVGAAEPLKYMMLYPDLKMEKIQRSDETTIYILTDKNTEKVFQFASRSLAFPAGY